jgi:hypothetical protein
MEHDPENDLAKSPKALVGANELETKREWKENTPYSVHFHMARQEANEMSHIYPHKFLG